MTARPACTFGALICYLLSLAAISTSCYKHETDEMVFADTLLHKAVIVQPQGVKIYQFDYGSHGKLAQVRSHFWAKNASQAQSSVWDIYRDGSGNILSMKAHNNLTSDTMVYQYSYTPSWQLSCVVARQVTKDHAASYPVDSVEYITYGNTTTGWHWGNLPFISKTEYTIGPGGNMSGKVVYSGYGYYPPSLPMSFSSSLSYTYDTRRAPLTMDHCEQFYHGFREEWFRSINNNVLTETYGNYSGPQSITTHRYSYNRYGQPLTDTIFRHTGDTVMVYYQYK